MKEVITEENFYKLYWNNYLQIENELIDIFKYIDLSIDNFKTYSSKLLKIYLQIGSEIDICLKLYCRFFSENNYDEMKKYKEALKEYDKEFCSDEAHVKYINITLKPWEKFFFKKELRWWKIYNKLKHDRASTVRINNKNIEAYKLANLINTLTSLCGLYILLVNIFSKIKGNREKVPYYNSRLFKIVSKRWENCKIYVPLYGYIKKNTTTLDTHLLDEDIPLL